MTRPGEDLEKKGMTREGALKMIPLLLIPGMLGLNRKKQLGVLNM